MVAEHRQNAVDLIVADQRAIDPNMIMNPGKIV